MEVHKLCFAIVALLLQSVCAMTAEEPDFTAARNKINAAKPNIDYKTFCSATKSGGDKIACRLKDVPSVGFLVCKTEKVEGEPCEDVIDEELNNIKTLGNDEVKTVTVSPPAITGVMCGNESSPNCTGFLEEWIDEKDGDFQHVRDHVSDGTVDNLIKTVESITTKEGIKTTATDLKKIVEYMTKGQGKYRQICDLQGFFLKKGGFLVNDVPALEDNLTLNGTCFTGEPTTSEVLDALNKMITAFDVDGATNTPSNSYSAQKLHLSFYFVVISLVFVFYLKGEYELV